MTIVHVEDHGARLTKTVTVCERIGGPLSKHSGGANSPGTAIFRAVDDDPESDHNLVIALDRRRWHDMGSPDIITVTVVPDDTLNDG